MYTIRLFLEECPKVSDPTHTEIERLYSRQLRAFLKSQNVQVVLKRSDLSEKTVNLTKNIPIQIYGVEYGKTHTAEITKMTQFHRYNPRTKINAVYLKMSITITGEAEKRPYNGRIENGKMIILTPAQEQELLSSKTEFFAIKKDILENSRLDLSNIPRIEGGITYDEYKKIKKNAIGFQFLAPKNNAIIKAEILAIITKDQKDTRVQNNQELYVLGINPAKTNVYEIKRGKFIKKVGATK